MPEKINWEAPPLTAEDERLGDAYMHVGRPLDDLPYTDDFEKLAQILGISDQLDSRHSLFKRLLWLRKTGRLPRLGYVGG
jgi:hypothetical protein